MFLKKVDLLSAWQLKPRTERIEQPIIPIGVNRAHHRRNILRAQDVVKKILVKDDADLLLDFLLLLHRIQAEDRNFSAILMDQVQKQLKRGAFACAVFADKAHDAALWQGKANIFELKSTVVLAKIRNPDAVIHQCNHSFLCEKYAGY